LVSLIDKRWRANKFVVVVAPLADAAARTELEMRRGPDMAMANVRLEQNEVSGSLRGVNDERLGFFDVWTAQAALEVFPRGLGCLTARVGRERMRLPVGDKLLPDLRF
jgi:hypothetical protein